MEHSSLMDSSSNTEFFPACDKLTNGTNTWCNINQTDLVNDSMKNNITYLEHAPGLTNQAYFKAIVLGIMATFSLLANVATIWSITKNRRKHHGCSAVYTLILHLSVADLLVTVFCIAGEGFWSYTVAWPWGNISCKIFKFLQMFSLYLSTFVLVLIGVDRFVAVRYPMKSLNTAQRCNRLVILTWIISFVLSIPQLVVFHVAKGPFVEDFTQCVTHGTYTEPWQEQVYAILSLIFMFILPLIFLIATYVSTVMTIAQSGKAFKSEITSIHNANRIAGDMNRRRLIHRAKSKSLRISIVIVAAFVIWWTPYYTMMIICMFLDPDDHLSKEMQSGIFFFGMSNSLVNPLIYGAFHLWPKKRRPGFRYRDGSTMQHRSTTTHASFMLTTRGGSTRLVRNQTKKSETIIQGNPHPTDETVLIKLIDEQKNNNGKTVSKPEKVILRFNPAAVSPN